MFKLLKKINLSIVYKLLYNTKEKVKKKCDMNILNKISFVLEASLC